MTNLECKLGFFVVVNALVRARDMIVCQFDSSGLRGNVSVEILMGGFAFSNSVVVQVMNFASVTSVSKRFIESAGGSTIEILFSEIVPLNSNIQCRFHNIFVPPAWVSLRTACCSSPPLPVGSANFSFFVDDQVFSEDVLLTVISSSVIYSFALNATSAFSKTVSLFGRFPAAVSSYFRCSFLCNSEVKFVVLPEIVSASLVVCPLPGSAVACKVFIQVENISSNVLQLHDAAACSATSVSPTSVLEGETKLLTVTGDFGLSCDCPMLHHLLTTTFASPHQLICLFQGHVSTHSSLLLLSNITVSIVTAKLLSIHPKVCFAGCNIQLEGFFPNSFALVTVDGIIHIPHVE
jgi:hypothetical protein